MQSSSEEDIRFPLLQSPLAGYAIAPLHLAVGSLFVFLPASVYQQGYASLYGAILVLLASIIAFYGWILWMQAPAFRVLWQQVLLASGAAAVPFFTIGFSDPWHAIVYPLILGGSLIACLGIGHVVLFVVRP